MQVLKFVYNGVNGNHNGINGNHNGVNGNHNGAKLQIHYIKENTK